MRSGKARRFDGREEAPLGTVLIVDDEPDLLLLLRVAFETRRHEVSLAADGDGALQKLREQPFDAVLLDLMMPALDGWAVLADRQRSLAAPPIVVISAAGTAAGRRAVSLGAACFVPKPFVVNTLIAKVEAVMAGGSIAPAATAAPA